MLSLNGNSCVFGELNLF